MDKVITSNSGKKYKVEEVQGIFPLGDYVRKLFRVTNLEDNTVSYKGIRISHTSVAVENAKDISLEEQYDEAFKRLEAEIINDNKENLDYFITTGGVHWAKLGEYGEII